MVSPINNVVEGEPKVAVVILNYNGKHHLFECFSSLMLQTYLNFEIYLLDNCSYDDSLEYTRINFPLVKIMAFNENLGFAKAYNKAIKRIDCDLIGILNNDTKVEADWLRSLVNAIIEDEKIIAVGSKMLLYDKPTIINHAGAKITILGGGFDIGLNEQDDKKFNIRKFVGAVCGGSMLVRRNLFLRLGGFDEFFSSYFEDVDFCWRAWQNGFKIFYEPKSVVYHKRSASWNKEGWFSTYLVERNRLYSMIKFFQGKRLLTACILSLPYALFKIVLFCVKNNIRGAMAIIKANVWALINFKILYGKKLIFSNKINDDYNKVIYASFSESFRSSLKFF
jgi:GT2 family glycosyltransferase